MCGTLCCLEITEDDHVRPAFQKMVVLDWYDGPSSGVMLCNVCSTEYSFFTLDWSDDGTIRVFALAAASVGTVGHISELFGETPKWPLWFPSQLRTPK